MRRGWSPHRRIGWAEEEDARNAARGGEMADTGIVAEKETPTHELSREFGEGKLMGRRAEAGEGGRGGGVGFAGHDEEVGAVLADKPRAEGDPVGERPVFLR